MIDLEINLRRLPRSAFWLVEIRSTEYPTVLEVPPLTDQDLAEVPDLAPAARSWKGFLASLSPGSPLPPGPAALRTVGGILMKKVLGEVEAVQHFAAVEARAKAGDGKVRLLLDVEDADPALDPILACLPVELAHDGTRFFFKRRERPVFRVAPQSEARNLRLGRGSRVLVATAHSDGRPPERWKLVRDVVDAIEPTPWSQGAPGGPHLAMVLSYADTYRWDRTLTEREAFLDLAEALSRGDTSRRRANVLRDRGDLRRFRDDLEEAARDYDDALALFHAVEDRLGQANVLQARGDLRLRKADREGAARDYDDALALFHAVEDRLGQANVLQARGDLRLRRADLEGAARDYDDALALFHAVEDRLGQANVLKARGDLESARDHQTQALGWYDEALRLYQEIQYPRGLGNTWVEIAKVRFQLGEVDAARQAVEEALRFAIPGENR